MLLKNDAGMLLLDPAGPRLAVVGPFAGMLRTDWYSGTMPYQVTVADGLREALPGGAVTAADGADRVRLAAVTPGAPDLGEFDVQHWGPGGPPRTAWPRPAT